jgi:NodT family efflux transporter outer membrane factor (OMF) lipoprotein
MNRARLVLVLLSCFAVMGCASAPGRIHPDTGIEVPSAWTAPTETNALMGADWWRDFADPHLEALVAEALANNLDLQAASARLDFAAATARIAGADLKPSIGLGIDAGRQQFNPAALGFTGGSRTFTTYGISLDTQWEVDLWGRIRAGTAAALADFQATEADLEAARLSIAGQAAKAWFGLTEARLQVELAERTVETFQSTVERVRSRFESGLRPSLDLRLALSDLSTGEALLEQRRGELDRAARQFEILLGRYPAAETAGSADLPAVPAAIPDTLPAELISRRPDLAAAERRLAAADARIAQARRALYPSFSLTARGGTLSTDLGDLIDGDFRVWDLMGKLLQPIFQGGRLRAGVDRSEADSDRALAEFAGSVLNALGEVESTLAAEVYLKSRQEDLARAVRQAEAALVLAQDRYDAGLESLITVLESQRRTINRQAELLQVRRLRIEARIDLYLALGGGFRYDDLFRPAATTQAAVETSEDPS